MLMVVWTNDAYNVWFQPFTHDERKDLVGDIEQAYASLVETDDYGCSGALINDMHVLTAAHCVQGTVFREKGGLKNVRLGEFNVRTDPDCIEEPNFLNCGDSALNVGVDKIW
uniref:Peptidase S1 domain-containing protein n=1 Tax=Megaselia scalaris TaxID=36166 RepID=T1GQI5_MEGSC